MIAILIPVLGRPHRVAPLVESVLAASKVTACTPYFLVSPNDDLEMVAVDETPGAVLQVMPFEHGPGDYARKMNWGFANTSEPFVFLAADDLQFRPGWAERAVACWYETNACVVGTNDLGSQRVQSGQHSTHTLVSREYGECGTIDDETKLLHEGYFHNFCNPPDAPIWMADLTFKAIGAVRVGDRVIGWEYDPAARPTVGAPRRSYCYSEVLAISYRESDLVRVAMESGREFRCTPDHRWLNAAWMPASNHDRQWVEPRVGRTLLHVAEEPSGRRGEFEREYGWLAGIYDGEGSGIVVATQSDKNPEIVAEITRLLRVLEIPHNHAEASGMHHFTLRGGRQAYLDFLLLVQPTRRRELAASVVGFRRRDSSRRARAEIGGRRFGRRDRIVAVEPLPGLHEVVSMTTTSGNYIAHGYASRNCDDEFVQTASYRGTYAQALDCRVEHLHPNWGKAKTDRTYAIGQQHFADDRVLYNERRALWGGSAR